MNDLPDDLREWVESTATARIVSARRHLAGASREAWSLDTDCGGLFLMRDGRPGSGGSARDAAVLRALVGSPVPVPRVYGNDVERSTVLLERVEGRGDFPEVDDEAEREPTARHLMELTAALHALDPATLDIAHLGSPPPPAAHAETQLAHAQGAVQALGDDAHPLFTFALAWLGRNLPTPPPATSLVHSDMGPGNFVSAGGRVVAVLDWEVAHWGDPMEDLAAVSIRDMATPVGDLPTRFAEYASVAAAPVRLDALKWYRVFVLTRNSAFITLGLRADPGSRTRPQLEMHRLNLMRAAALTLCDAVGSARPVEPLLAAATGDPTTYGPDEQAADLSDMSTVLGSRPVDATTGWRAIAALSDDAGHDQVVAELLARHMLRRGMVGAAILGPLAERLPQLLERS